MRITHRRYGTRCWGFDAYRYSSSGLVVLNVFIGHHNWELSRP